MSIFNKDRAEEAYKRTPDHHISELWNHIDFTKFQEVKISDHRVSYELKRIADALEEIANK